MLGLLLKLIGSCALLYILKALLNRPKLPAPLPPGPSPKPIIGNLKDLPSHGSQDWIHWHKHKALYGPISSVSVFGQTLIILNDARLAFELLDKHSAIQSSRPTFHFAKMAGFTHILGLVEYGESFRAYRKALHQQIGSNIAVSRFDHIQDEETRKFLLRLLVTPDKYMDHIRKEAGAIILKIGYGYEVERHGRDPLVDLGDRGMDEFSQAVLPGTWLVDFVPILRYIPAWVPGASFARTAEKFHKTFSAMGNRPFDFVKRKMARGSIEPSYLSNLLRNRQVQPGSFEEDVAKWSAASLYAGGADTTVSTIACFLLAMILYPEVQKTAQAEIDRVVGTSRLPGYEDRDHLPYVNAMVKEVLRWHPVAPMGVAHMSTEDDMCEGYFIPKGSVVLANIWSFTHDPDTYADPMAFNPARFLDTDGHKPEKDPHLLSFGFGRRVCPGRNLADSNVYLSVVRVLAALEIAKPVPDDGQEGTVEPEFWPGVISHPAPFDISIRPRSRKHEDMIRAVEVPYVWGKSDADEISEYI